MVGTEARHHVTSEEFLTHPSAERSELVCGDVRMMTPASGAHGAIAGTIFAALNGYVEKDHLGLCFPDNTGFLLPGLGDTVRSPDVAFVREDNLPRQGIGAGWMNVAPDLVVEILSPSETRQSLEEKLRDYQTAGTRLIWVVDAGARLVTVRRSDGGEQSHGEGDMLDGGDVLPGLVIPVARIFARLAR